jgi:hypothetical protein
VNPLRKYFTEDNQENEGSDQIFTGKTFVPFVAFCESTPEKLLQKIAKITKSRTKCRAENLGFLRCLL